MSADGYTEGAIVRIKLINVLTYDSVEFKCGPHLNVVIGPNGTGKSTIVCAICLGLAGRTSWLGRAQQPSDFIKYGQNKAHIELELYNPDGDNSKISRDIHRDNTSKWMVNDRSSTQKAVEELVKRLNIQVGNLTQFLPQEKVADFAKMSESELLENTEKAIGDTELYECHQKLKESQMNTRSLVHECMKLEERIELETQKNARIEQDVKNFEERQRFLKMIETLKQKKAWVEYTLKKELFKATKDEMEAKEKMLKSVRQAYAPLQRRLDEARGQRDQIEDLIKTKSAELRDVAKKAEAKSTEGDSLTEKLIEIQDDKQLKKDQEEARRKRLRELNRQLEALQNELQNSDDNSENVQPLIDNVNRSMREVTQKMGQISMQGDRLRADVDSVRNNIRAKEKQLKIVRDTENRRLETLRAKHKDTYDAVMWLRANKDRFSGTVHEPPMLSVNMKNANLAKYFENHVAFNDMRAFVCENSETFNLFMDAMRMEQRLKVNAVKTPPRVTLESFRPKQSIDTYRRYGFHGYLQSMFTCPDPVMKFLCAQYRVHQIPVGSERTKEMVDRVIDELPELTCFYAADHQYMIKKSRYDGSMSSRNQRLKDASLLTVSMDENRERDLVQELEQENASLREKEEKYGNLQRESQELEHQLNKLRDEKKQLTTRKDHKKKLMQQIESKKQTIRTVEKECINLEELEQTVKQKTRGLNMKKYNNMQAYKEYTQMCVAAISEKVRLRLRQVQMIRQYNQLESEIRDKSQALQQAEADCAEVKERVVQCRQIAKQYLAAARKATNSGTSNEVSKELEEEFLQLPDTIEDIDAKIHEHQVRADCTIQTDERVVVEYHKREADITSLREQLAEKQHIRDNQAETIAEMRRSWLEPLNDLLTRINTSFSEFFHCLKCVGEIDLKTPDNPEDYNKYGIRIRVKFRDTEPLRELSAHHQSGGERSVTTVLFMMALQDLARCPFRCVDEINQGMDPVNERKVFEVVVKTVCQRSSSQYFLLTPKLLPDLEYEDRMTVLCIYNGGNMLDHSHWKHSRFMRRRINLES